MIMIMIMIFTDYITILLYYLLSVYYSLFVGNFQEALEDLHRIEEITGKSKFFLTVCLCIYPCSSLKLLFFLWIHRIYIPTKQVTL